MRWSCNYSAQEGIFFLVIWGGGESKSVYHTLLKIHDIRMPFYIVKCQQTPKSQHYNQKHGKIQVDSAQD